MRPELEWVLEEKPEGMAWVKGPVYVPIIGNEPPSGLTPEQVKIDQDIRDGFDNKPF